MVISDRRSALTPWRRRLLRTCVLLASTAPGTLHAIAAAPDKIVPQTIQASSDQPDFPAASAADGDRLSVQRGRYWKGAEGESSWSWTASFREPTEIGAVLQVLGGEESFDAAAPISYAWQSSDDGETWHDVAGARVVDDRRLYRILRFAAPVRARHLRLAISATSGGEPPMLREVEFYPSPDAAIEFPDWLLIISSHHEPVLATCHRYLDLARKCDGWADVPGQFLWHGYLDPALVEVEPRPLCLLFGGSSKEWCQVDREGWKGVEALLHAANYPIWGACGGAQVFGLLEEVGADAPWDCPNCRDPKHPKSPIYGHIGLVDPAKGAQCSHYENNLYEIGPTPVRVVHEDPVFAGLPRNFQIPEYHCGQLEHVPQGWRLLATKGDGGKTWMQCMKKDDACIYGAQFHIEHQGTPTESRIIMSNFLREAKRWNKDHPRGAPQRSQAAATGEASSHVSAADAGQ